MPLTRSDIEKVNAIKIDVDHFGYTLTAAEVNDDSITLTLVKTSEYKKHNGEYDKIDEKFFKQKEIRIRDTETPLYFKENIINLSNQLLRVINLLKTGK